jgi:type II secretory ATPase GspE/PulE/Tfp pilus assembly ATPase PilB-like protein/GAF domain-containing protein
MALKDVLLQVKTEKERNNLFNKLTAHQEISGKLQGSESLADLLARASDIRALVDADWVFAWALSDSTLVTRDPGGGEVRVPVAQAGIPGHAATTGQSVNIKDVYDDKELKRINPKLSFNKAADQASGYRTRAVLCAPVINRGQTIGVIQAINKVSGGSFDFLDVESLCEMANSLGGLMHQVIEMDQQGRRLRYQEKLNAIINSIHAAREVDQILISLIHDIRALFDSQRVTVYAVDPQTEELFSRTKVADEVKEFRVPVDRKSIAGYAAATRKPVMLVDVYDEEELARIDPELSFNRSFDEKSGFRTKQVLATPIEFQGELEGCLQLINRTDGHEFDTEDLERARALAETLGIAFHNQVMAGARRNKFDWLVEKRLLKRGQVKEARARAKEEGASVESVLIGEYGVSKGALLEAMSEFYRCGTFEFDQRMVIPQSIVERLKDSYDDLKHGHWVPIEMDAKKAVVVIDDPKDVVRRDHVQTYMGDRRVEYRVATPEDVTQTIDLIFGMGDGSMSDALLEMKEGPGPLAEEDEAGAEVKEDDKGIVKFVNRIIEDAYRRGASDVHIEPSPEGEGVLRVRVDGALQKVMTFPKGYRNAILSRIKIMSGLDIAERRKPQSGKIRFRKWGKLDIELRVETCPTVGGTEDAVMRILASSKPLPLEKMGFSERNLRKFKEVVENPYGIILCVGPTGSGKTTTLHSALGYINREDIKIWTAEDPVEITQRGLRQVQVNRKAGLTFAEAMRSFLRADPDVVMIGEMRDQETAATGVEASLTGHLVFSTLHTNSAPETITRLVDMDIDPYSFADAMLGILAQRLGRTVCKKCREKYVLSEE